MLRTPASLTCCCVLSLCVILGTDRPSCATPIQIATVPVGNAGNAPDQLYPTNNPQNLQFGAVDYNYRIGKYEVTNAQYAAFLNAVAASDPLSLYNTNMGSNVHGGITRSGAAGSYSYAAKPNMGNKPVNLVNYYSAVRFTNWLHHGQPTGSDSWITETGAYTLLGGAGTPSNGLTLTRNSGAQWFLPSEDEWYKAAYYNPLSDSYYVYPTSGDTVPSGGFPPGGANSANFFGGGVGTVTDVGAYVDSLSPYGTYDQGGNLREWNEARIGELGRGARGGAFGLLQANSLAASARGSLNAESLDAITGFRVATVPEPSTLLSGAVGVATLLLVGLWSRTGRRRFTAGGALREAPVLRRVLTSAIGGTQLTATFGRVIVIAIGSCCAVPAHASQIAIETVRVGDPGNPAFQASETLQFGSVDYVYHIGKYEVTNAQYAAFLNAKASSDPLHLYSSLMGSDVRGGIARSGSDGSFVYAVKPNMGNKPVTFVNFYRAIRFTNWLHNGQGAGDTENGAYTLHGGTPIPTNSGFIARNDDAKWWLPNRDEWYKAGHFDPALNDGLGGYWSYPTRSNAWPTLATANSVGDIDNPGANTANHANSASWNDLAGNVTTVGSAGALSQSFYGTSDQGGNVWEWLDNRPTPLLRQVTGGAWSGNVTPFWSFGTHPLAFSRNDIGFRVATVPEPSTLALAVGGLVTVAFAGRRSWRLQCSPRWGCYCTLGAWPHAWRFAFARLCPLVRFGLWAAIISVVALGARPSAAQSYQFSHQWNMPAGGTYDFTLSWLTSAGNVPLNPPTANSTVAFGNRQLSTLADQYVMFLQDGAALSAYFESGNYELRFGNPNLTFSAQFINIGQPSLTPALPDTSTLTAGTTPFGYPGSVSSSYLSVGASRVAGEAPRPGTLNLTGGGTSWSAEFALIGGGGNAGTVNVLDGAQLSIGFIEMCARTRGSNPLIAALGAELTVFGVGSEVYAGGMQIGLTGPAVVEVKSHGRLTASVMQISDRAPPVGTTPATYGYGTIKVGDYSGQDTALITVGEMLFSRSAGGTLDLRGGGSIVVGGDPDTIPVGIRGTLVIEEGGLVHYDNSGSPGMPLVDYVVHGDVVIRRGATLRGVGQIDGDLINEGDFIPSIRGSTIGGNFTQSERGVITVIPAQTFAAESLLAPLDDIQVEPLATTTDALLRVEGDLVLAGILEIQLYQYELQVGERLRLFEAGGVLDIAGLTLDWKNAPSGLRYDLELDGGALALYITAVPEPSTLALAGLGLTAVALAGKRRWRLRPFLNHCDSPRNR